MAPQTLPETRLPDNPWIVRNGVPVGISAEEIARRLDDLRTWSAETGQPLPFPADYIVQLEVRGYVVNLETGQRSVAPKFAPLDGGARG